MRWCWWIKQEGVVFHRDQLRDVRRLVVKIGSSTIVNAERRFNFKIAEALAEDIVKLKKQGLDVLLVSSGAIALGRNGHSSELDKRIAAAKGQVALMTGWREVFAMHAIDVCQVLVSNGCNIDFNALRTANLQIVINGNDVIEETNNDLVASKVARNTNADLLVLLTNVDGYLDGTGKRISSIHTQDSQFFSSTL